MKIEPKSSDREVLADWLSASPTRTPRVAFASFGLGTRPPRAGHLGRSCRRDRRRITATGNWVNDRTHGQQFKARLLKTSIPTSVDGIERYLASGMIRGLERVSVSRRKVASFLAGTRYQPGHLTEFCRKCSPCFRSTAVS